MQGKTVSQRIKSARRQRGFSQRSLSNAMGISSANISFWENGLNVPNVTNLNKLSETLNVSIEWLENGDDIHSMCHSSVKLWEIPDDADVSTIDAAIIEVPGLKIDIRKSQPAILNQDMSYPVHREVFNLCQSQSRKIAVFGVIDNKMVPTLHKDDIVLIDTENVTEFSKDNVYLIVLNQRQLMFTRVENCILSKRVWIDSVGPEQATQISDSDWQNVAVLGRVIFRFGAL